MEDELGVEVAEPEPEPGDPEVNLIPRASPPLGVVGLRVEY